MEVSVVRNRGALNEDQMRLMRWRIRSRARNELISRLILYTNLCTNDVAVSDLDRDAMKKRFEGSFCRKGQSFDDLRDILRNEEVEDAFMRCFAEDVKVETALHRLYPDRLSVTDRDVADSVEYMKNYNAMAAATNALICALATNVLEKIRGGGDFAALADEFSMDAEKNPGGDLGERTIESFADDGAACMTAAASLKVGDVSGILLGTTGYMILKKTGDNTYSQIFFRKPYEMESLPRAELVEELKKENREELLKELMKEFATTAKIEYPQGDVFSTNPQDRPSPKKLPKPKP